MSFDQLGCFYYEGLPVFVLDGLILADCFPEPPFCFYLGMM